MEGEQEIQKAYESILSHDFEKAIEWFEKAIAVEPDNAAYHHKLSITYARSNRLQAAFEHAEAAVRLVPDYEPYRFHLQTLRARELVEQAEKDIGSDNTQAIWRLRQAIGLDPLAIEAYLILGEAYARRHDFAAALQAVQEALRLEPGHEAAVRLVREYEQKIK